MSSHNRRNRQRETARAMLARHATYVASTEWDRANTAHRVARQRLLNVLRNPGTN